MAFRKGVVANPEGRPFGAKDRINSKIRDKFRKLVEDNFDQLQEDIKILKPRERVDAIIRLSSFILPKMQSIQITEMPEVYELLQMTSEERKAELLRLKKMVDEKK